MRSGAFRLWGASAAGHGPLVGTRQRFAGGVQRSDGAPRLELATLPGAGGGDGSGETDFLDRTRSAIEASIGDEALSVERLAEVVGVSRGHLHRRLRALADQTPSALIRTMRLERAAELLASRGGTVSEVAYAVGFRSVSHFSNSFTTEFGCRPSVYRAEASASQDRPVSAAVRRGLPDAGFSSRV